MTFVEHNNREKAKKYAEYITGQELRQYLADKVKAYCGDNPTVFDGACGSGQLEQYIEPKLLYGVEIQTESCEAVKQNYPTSMIFNQSFFEFDNGVLADCVIMNPPFSMKFKDLSDSEKSAIQADFSWKKSGAVDDIFILKSLNYTSRYAFHICFCGVAYRNAEKKMRELIGNQLAEIHTIQNAFEDTQIDVLFLVIDKQKTDSSYQTSIYDCKAKETLVSETKQLDDEYRWQTARVIVEEYQYTEADIDQMNIQLNQMNIDRLELHIKNQLMLWEKMGAKVGLPQFFHQVKKIVAKYEKEYYSKEQMELLCG